MKNIALLAFVSLFTFGCSTTPQSNDVQTPIVLHPQKPTPLELSDLTWEVWNYDRLQEEALNADPENSDFAIVVLNVDGYKAYALNIEEIERYLKEQNIQLLYYRALFPEKQTKE